jgi:hypothetical protein
LEKLSTRQVTATGILAGGELSDQRVRHLEGTSHAK